MLIGCVQTTRGCFRVVCRYSTVRAGISRQERKKMSTPSVVVVKVQRAVLSYFWYRCRSAKRRKSLSLCIAGLLLTYKKITSNLPNDQKTQCKYRERRLSGPEKACHTYCKRCGRCPCKIAVFKYAKAIRPYRRAPKSTALP